MKHLFISVSAAAVFFLSFCDYRSILTFFKYFPAGTPHKDICWAETVVHPVLLRHPFPRKVLVSGTGTRTLVKESLRHFTTTLIYWVDSSSTDLALNEDILRRTQRRRSQHPNDFQNVTLDVIILDELPSLELVSTAAAQLSQDGILAVALGNAWEQALNKLLITFEHVDVFTPYDSTEKSSLYAVATNSNDYPSPTHLSVAHINTLIGRRIVPKSQLDHFDGEAHLRMFLLPRHLRRNMIEIYQKSSRQQSSLGDEHNVNAGHSTVTTLTREFFHCENLPSTITDTNTIIEKSFINGEANLKTMSSSFWNSYQNTTGLHVASDFDTSTTPMIDSSTNTSYIPAHLTVTAIFDGGSLSLHIFPRINFVAAVITNYNNWACSDEVLDSLSVAFDPQKVTGSKYAGMKLNSPDQFSALHERMSHFGDREIGSIDYWELDDLYWSSPKIDLRDSPVAGKGNWATKDISEGEMVFKGFIEPSLVHLEEYELYPQWKKLYIDHYGEQAHDEILVAPSRAQEDLSYFTNHACSPNIKYDDAYDQMIAIRNITAGEELTFDYATVSSDPQYKLECHCGGTTCRRQVTGKDWQDEAVVANLGKGAFWPFLKAKILTMELDKE